MGWRGVLFGGMVANLFGTGPLGTLIGAVTGHVIEKAFGASSASRGNGDGALTGEARATIFCVTAAALMAKMAKADGVVTKYEIAKVEESFRRLGFSPLTRRRAIEAFRRAKDDRYSIFVYAQEFARVVSSVEVRELLYEILWDVACADGEVSAAELQLLRRLPHALGIPLEWYGYYASRRLGGAGRERRSGADAPSRDEIAEAYVLLGARPDDDDEEVRRKYRELAKRNHPDALRAQGLPEEMAGRATERMSRINAAWETVRKARGM